MARRVIFGLGTAILVAAGLAVMVIGVNAAVNASITSRLHYPLSAFD